MTRIAYRAASATSYERCEKPVDEILLEAGLKACPKSLQDNEESSRRSADMEAPSLDQLQRKARSSAVAHEAQDSDIKMVRVVPADADPESGAAGPGSQVAVISLKQGRIIGRSG